MACGEKKNDANKNGSSKTESPRNDSENVKANSGENISPQLESDTGNRLKVDTISNPREAEKQKKDHNLH